MDRLRAVGVRAAIIFGLLLAADFAVYVYVWGQRGTPSLHIPWLVPAAIVLAILHSAAKLIFAGNDNIAWLARLHLPHWSSFEPFFKNSRFLLPIVVLSYVLFYVTEGINEQSGWALWVNNNILNFYFLCRKFTAIDVIRIEIAGYALYLALYGLYLYYCPQIVAHSVRKKGGLAREDAALVLVDTIERHGASIPPGHLTATIANLASENMNLIEEGRHSLLDHRLESLQNTSRSNPPSPMAVAADAAGVARLLPPQLAIESYYLGRDLFDILYPAARGILSVGLAVAVLATSLPVAAKLVWVVLPRFGEQCMVDMVQVQPTFRDSDWIEFDGQEESRNANEVILIPDEDHAERWHLAPDDVTQIDVQGLKRILLRKGGRIREFAHVPGSVASPPPPAAPSSRMSQQCGVNGSRCSNHTEICCGSNTVIGRCYGRWSCPVP